MSRMVERSMTCPDCGKTFHGYSRGQKGEKQAYWDAFKLLQDHECLPREKPDPFPKISGVDLDAIIAVIQQKLPGVTITHHKV